jgi:hypothetical protein
MPLRPGLDIVMTDERLLTLFERRALRCIFGAVQGAVCGGKDVTMKSMNFLMSQILSSTLKLTDWGGLGVMHMDSNRTVKKVFNIRPEGTRKIGRDGKVSWLWE